MQIVHNEYILYVYMCDTHTHTHTYAQIYVLYFFNVHIHTHTHFLHKAYMTLPTIIVAVTEDLVREEQFLHDMCLLGAVTVEITQLLTRAGFTLTQVYLNPS